MEENEYIAEEQVEASTVGYTDHVPAKAQSLKKSKTVTAYRFFHAFQIETVVDGYNSGRIYHIRAENKDRCDNIATTISALSIKARKAAMKASRFQKSQKMVLRVYGNSVFQLFITTLILLVSWLAQISISSLHS